MKITVAFAACVSLVGTATLSGEVHTWTNLAGQTVEAEMVGMDVAARAVRVQTAGGQTFTIPIAKLSAEDVAYAAAQWRLMQASGKVPPAAPVTAGTLPPRFSSRCTGASRLAQITKHGGTPECETAVTKSLRWLKDQQNADGSWGRLASSRAGYTALVLQCYTGRCEGVASPEYGEAVLKAIDFLVQAGARNPFGILAVDPKTASAAYEHGMATTALGEAYVLAQAGGQAPLGLREAFERAVKAIISAQGKKGSWDYYPSAMLQNQPPSSREDLSVTNWQLQALLVAREAGLKDAGLEPCIAKAANYLESKQTKDGGFGGPIREHHYNQWHMSGGALLALQTLAPDSNTARISKGLRFLRTHLTQEPMNWDGSCNLYTWVSNTPAFFHAGGDDWKFYRDQLLPQLLTAQEADGSFRAGKADWPASAAADPIYRQALCTLQLEVFYRHAK